MITMSQRSAGIEPSTNSPATISPHSAIGPGFAATARNDVVTAVPAPTSRSSNSGNDTTLIDSTISANRKPTPIPMPIIAQPRAVVNTSRTKPLIEAGGSGPSVQSEIAIAAPSHNRNSASNTSPSPMIAGSDGEWNTSK